MNEEGFVRHISWDDWQQWSDKKQEQLVRFCFLQLCCDISRIKTLVQSMEALYYLEKPKPKEAKT